MVEIRASLRPGGVSVTFWGRAWAAMGLFGGGAYLFVLPFGHVTALRSIALALALTAAVGLWASRAPRLIPLLPVFAVWLAAAALSLFTTRDLDASLSAISSDVLRSFLVFFVFYTLTLHLPAYRTWVAATALGFALLSGLAVVSFLEHGKWVSYYVPLLGDFATSAVTVLPLLAGYVVLAPRDRRLAAIVVVALAAILAGGYVTFSRAFWLSMICGTGLAALLYVRRSSRLDARWSAVAVLVSIAALALAAFVSSQRGRDLTHFDDRLPIYTAVAKKIVTNPLTGTGYGHETDKPWYEAVLPGTSIFHPHNVVLSYLDQMGVFGLIALVAIFGMPTFVFARHLGDASREAGIAAACGLVLLAIVFVKNTLDYFFLKQNLWLFFAHLGIYLAAIQRTRRNGLVPAVDSRILERNYA